MTRRAFATATGIGIAFGGGTEALEHLVDTPQELAWAKAKWEQAKRGHGK